MVTEVKDLLGRFNDILLKNEGRNIFIIDAIFQATNIRLKNEDIKIKNNSIYLNIKPIYKNKIFLKKDNILDILKIQIGKKSPDSFK